MVIAEYSGFFTAREVEVLKLLAHGFSNAQIAVNLNISVRTVKFHTSNIYNKIKVDSRSAAIAWTWKNHEQFDTPLF